MRLPGPRQDGDGDRGSLTLMLAVMFVALLALAGIVIDGGAKLNQAENAAAIAQEAARAGAGMVNQANAYTHGSFTVDHGSALPVGTQSIEVTVTVTGPTRVLSIVGIDSMTSTASATASLVTGVTGPQA